MEEDEMLHPDDLPEGVEAGDLMVQKYTLLVLVPRERVGAPKSASLAGWMEYDRGRALAEDVTGMGPSPPAIVCALGRHVIACPVGFDPVTVAEGCDYCIGDAERAYERRMEG